MEKSNYKKWIYKRKDGQIFAFRNIRCVEGFNVAVRVGLDGVSEVAYTLMKQRISKSIKRQSDIAIQENENNQLAFII